MHQFGVGMVPQIPALNPHRPFAPSGLRHEVCPESSAAPAPAARRDPAAPVEMPPFGRALPPPGAQIEFPPLRPNSPTGSYVPGPGADPAVMETHRGMANHKYSTFRDHPDAAMRPAGGLKLGYAYADALMSFRAQVRSMPDQTQMCAQTYRIGNGEFLPVHPRPVQGAFGEVALPGGSYPPGTGLVIFSHPADPANPGRAGKPEPQEMLRAYQDRTNALHGQGTQVGMHMLYDAGTDMAYAYDGRLGADGKPKFFQAIVPQVPQVRTEAILPGAYTPAPPLSRPPREPELYVPGHEIFPPSAEVGYLVPPHISPRASQPASPARPHTPTPPASPKWDEWLDFTGGSP